MAEAKAQRLISDSCLMWWIRHRRLTCLFWGRGEQKCVCAKKETYTNFKSEKVSQNHTHNQSQSCFLAWVGARLGPHGKIRMCTCTTQKDDTDRWGSILLELEERFCYASAFQPAGEHQRNYLNTDLCRVPESCFKEMPQQFSIQIWEKTLTPIKNSCGFFFLLVFSLPENQDKDSSD